MSSKLTLTLPDTTIERVKCRARAQGKSVSALVAEAIEAMPDDEARLEAIFSKHPGMRQIVGVFDEIEAFDERSAYILRKHGSHIL